MRGLHVRRIHVLYGWIELKYDFACSTEKLWRPFHVGSVPIVYGSPSVKEVFPTNKSAIELLDFKDPQHLAQFLTKLNENDQDYDKYLKFKTKSGVQNQILLDLMSKRKWGINNDQTRVNYIDDFECLVCQRLHENRALRQAKKQIKTHQATLEHYGCPLHYTFSENGVLMDQNYAGSDRRDNSFKFSYDFAYSLQKIFFEKYMPNHVFNFTASQIRDDALRYYHNMLQKDRNQIDL